jgi:hypothetical protein
VFRHIYLDERSIRFKADPTKRDAPGKVRRHERSTSKSTVNR